MRIKNAGIVLGLIICLGLFGCAGQEKESIIREGDGRLCVATTLFPYYDFVRQIAKDRVKLKLFWTDPGRHACHSKCRYFSLQRRRDRTVGGKGAGIH